MTMGSNEVDLKFLIDDSTVCNIFLSTIPLFLSLSTDQQMYASLERVIKNVAVSNSLYRCVDVFRAHSITPRVCTCVSSVHMHRHMSIYQFKINIELIIANRTIE